MRGIKPISIRRAFTLVEFVIASAISVIVLVAVLSSFTVVTQNLKAGAHYGQIHREGRMAVDTFAKDFRKAFAVGIPAAGTFLSNTVTLSVPTGFNDSGSMLGTYRVRYYLSGTSLIREVDPSSDPAQTLATDVSTVTFTLYNRVGTPTTNAVEWKGCHVEIHLRKTLVGTVQTEDYLSARVIMRDKPSAP